MATKAEISFRRADAYFHGLTLKDAFRHSQEATNAIDDMLAFLEATMLEPDVTRVKQKYADVSKRKRN